MALPYKIDKKEEIPTGCEEHYTETNGAFYLDATGMVPSTRLDEFRNNNTELKKKVEAFGDLDPVKCKEWAAKADELENFKAKGEDQIKTRVEQQTAKMKEDHDKQVQALTQRAETAEQQLARVTIDRGIVEAGAEYGLRQSAHDDVVNRARGVWKLENGTPVAYDEKGEKIYGKDGQPIGMKEWTEGLVKGAPHLFEESKGGDAAGNRNRGTTTVGANPWKAETFNMTKQAEIFRRSPDEARRLAAAAGKTI